MNKVANSALFILEIKYNNYPNILIFNIINFNIPRL
jgi:hypothetical protein